MFTLKNRWNINWNTYLLLLFVLLDFPTSYFSKNYLLICLFRWDKITKYIFHFGEYHIIYTYTHAHRNKSKLSIKIYFFLWLNYISFTYFTTLSVVKSTTENYMYDMTLSHCRNSSNEHNFMTSVFSFFCVHFIQVYTA